MYTKRLVKASTQLSIKLYLLNQGRKKKTLEYVAVKSIDKSRKKKVLNEVKIINNLSHPNIIKFQNWYETRNHFWIIFEYCSGGDLMQLLE
jgi:serine/threonine-protein kinase ULK4